MTQAISRTTSSSSSSSSYVSEPLTGTDVLTKDFLLDVRIIVTGLLDSEKALKGLYTLITQKWPVMGASLASLSHSRMELRIPSTFDKRRSPVFFDTYDAPHDVQLDQCFARLPDVDDIVINSDKDLIAFGECMELRSGAYERLHKRRPESPLAQQCATPSGTPTRILLKQLLDTDTPLLTVILHLFPSSNETVVRIIFPHCVFDASNIGAFLRAWSDSVNGHLERIPTVLTFDKAPEAMHVVKTNTKPYAPSGYRYAGPLQIVQLVFCLLWRAFLLPLLRRQKPSRPGAALVWVPEDRLEAWREEARTSAKENGQSSDQFLSENDLCISWILQRLATVHNSTLDGNVDLGIALNVRTQLPELAKKLGIDLNQSSRSKSLQAATSIYPHNGVVAINVARFAWHDVGRWPKWSLAFKTRQALEQARTPSQQSSVAHIMASIHHAHVTPKAPMLLPMHPTSLFCITTSWRQSDPLGAVDFSAAVLPSSGASPPNKHAAKTPPGKASDIFVTEEQSKSAPPIIMTIFSFTRRPGQGLLLGVSCDRRDVERGLFGRYVNLLSA